MTLLVEKKKQKPHLALTHNELQNGSANKRNVSLLMKSDVEIDEDTAALIEKVTGVKVSVTKASTETVRNLIREGLNKFKTDKWDWVYVEDWDDRHVVFGHEGGLYYTTLEVDGLSITLGDVATEVSRVVNFAEKDGSAVLDNHMVGIDGGVKSLIVKSFDNIVKNEKLMDVLKSKKGNQMQVEIQKAVDEATKVLKADLESANNLLKEAQDTIASFEKAAQEQKESQRKEAVAEVIADNEQAEAFLKSTESLSDEAFQTVVKTLKDKKEVVENSDLFTKSSEAAPLGVEDEEPLHRKMLKEQYGAK